MPPPLHRLITTRGPEIVARWASRVKGTLTPESLPRAELADHMPAFLEELSDALRQEESPSESPTAAKHGVQRLRLGFNLGAVVREYGVLHESICEVAQESGVAATQGESRVLIGALITGIADASDEYAQQRTAELQRQATEHYAFIAHELRNPLNSARLALRLLWDKGRIDPSEHLAGVLDRGLRQMQELMDHSLELAREAWGAMLSRGEVDLRMLLRDLEGLVAIDAEAKGARFRCSLDSGGKDHVTLDPRLVSSALSNVTRNAVKFTKAGTDVELRARVAGGHLTIEVEDACGGLEPGMVERAFAPFVQGNARKDGFGLGLAIAKQAVDAHGGTIRVQNLPGKGCVFVLDFPLGEAS